MVHFFDTLTASDLPLFLWFCLQVAESHLPRRNCCRQTLTVMLVTVLPHVKVVLAVMTRPGITEKWPCALQCALGTALAPAGLSRLAPPGWVLVLTAARVVPGCAVDASAAVGAAERTVAAITARMSFRWMDMLFFSLVPVRMLRDGGETVITVPFMILSFPLLRLG